MGKPKKTNKLVKHALQCARKLMKNKADRTFGEQDPAYKQLVEVISDHRLYKSKKDAWRHVSPSDKDDDELNWLWYSAE